MGEPNGGSGSRAGRLPQLDGWTFAPRRPLQSAAYLCRVQLQFGDGPAQGVAVHTQLARGLALIAAVPRQHFQNEAFLELAYGFGISDAAGLHVCHQTVQLSLQRNLSLAGALPGFFRRYPVVRIHYPIALSVPLLIESLACGFSQSGCASRMILTPSRIRSPRSAGVTAVVVCAAERKYGASCEWSSQPLRGKNAARAMTPKVTTTQPLRNPNSAPTRRSSQPRPIERADQCNARPISPATTMIASAIARKAMASATAGVWIACSTQGISF